jgi:hypothetical protein
MDKSKISTGLNDRPRNESISQTAPGLPDDTARPVEIDDAEVERVRAKLMKSGKSNTTAEQIERENEAVQKGAP